MSPVALAARRTTSTVTARRSPSSSRVAGQWAGSRVWHPTPKSSRFARGCRRSRTSRRRKRVTPRPRPFVLPPTVMPRSSTCRSDPTSRVTEGWKPSSTPRARASFFSLRSATKPRKRTTSAIPRSTQAWSAYRLWTRPARQASSRRAATTSSWRHLAWTSRSGATTTFSRTARVRAPVWRPPSRPARQPSSGPSTLPGPRTRSFGS